MAIVIGSNSVIVVRIQSGKGKDAEKEVIKVHGMDFDRVVQTVAAVLKDAAGEEK